MRNIKELLANVKLTAWDKVVTLGNPEKQLSRYKSKAALALAGAYTGASKSRRQSEGWVTSGGDADSDITYDLPSLRERSRDLCRNNPLARGAINTKVTSVIGSGLKLNANVDEKILGISTEEAKVLNDQIESEWKLFSKYADIRRTHSLNYLQGLIYRSEKESGDVIVNLPMVERPESPYQTKIQIIEGDRLSNPNSIQNTETLVDGVEKDRFGAPKWYHIQKTSPLSMYEKREWQKLKAFGTTTGRKNAIHYYNMERPGQTRGVPDLSPVIEMLKQLGRYTDAEIEAAVISGMFAVFIKSENGESFGLADSSGESSGTYPQQNINMSGGVISELGMNESIESVTPGRPNQNFDPFFQAMAKQIGACLELPHDLLVKQFDKSFSAAKAVLLEAWRYFIAERERFSEMVLDPVYESFFTEAVALGRINAPQFLSGDPIVKGALLRKNWKGAAKGNLKDLEAITAAEKKIAIGLSTIQAESDELGTGDWDSNHQQREIEHKARTDAGLIGQPTETIQVLDDDDE